MKIRKGRNAKKRLERRQADHDARKTNTPRAYNRPGSQNPHKG